jgi:hypothetical protein
MSTMARGKVTLDLLLACDREPGQRKTVLRKG